MWLIFFLLLSCGVAAADGATLPRVINMTSVANPHVNGLYVLSSASMPTSFARLGSDPMWLYRSAKLGTWLMAATAAEVASDKGEILSTASSDSPLGLSWRFRRAEDGKWPSDKTLDLVDITSTYDAELAYELSKVRQDELDGVRAIVVRRCPAGVGRALASGEVVFDDGAGPIGDSYDSNAATLRPPASFTCPFRSAHCYDGSPIYCDFSVDFATEIVRMYESELEVSQGEAERLDRTLRDLDGHGQTQTLSSALQGELQGASLRVYVMEPWLRFKAFLPIADAIILFSSFATLGVGMGIFGAFLLMEHV